MYDFGVLAEDTLVRETDTEHISRTIVIARGSFTQYHVRVRDVVVKNSVATGCNFEPERGHLNTWDEAHAYMNQQIERFKTEGFDYDYVSKELLRTWTLYRDIPQRHYRQIAAHCESDISGDSFFVVVLEGKILSVDPFEKQRDHRDLFICGSAEQAEQKGRELHKLGIADGWFDYHPVNG